MSVSEKILNSEGIKRVIRNPYLAIASTKHFHVIGEDGKGEYSVVLYEWETTSKFRVEEDLVLYRMTVKEEPMGISYIMEENRKGGNYYKITFMNSGNSLTVMVIGKKGGGVFGKTPYIEPEHILDHIKQFLS
ncbi:hypothetical protein IC006_0283 [Sulfuracidifex tepidarius]|uniref:Uncharacterized protein n=1 Tax=Sulfuracidifex tepidarius TaxID=1294262 RepID=A0A510DS36_9CREN|nr:hypothetical protein IC006_0283 [Sulfuracidifex tepidarius]